MSSSSSTSKKRKAQESQTLTPIKNPHQDRQEEEQKSEENGNDHDLIAVPYLPTDIITQILSRVRMEDLFNCRLVCKSWATLISTPEFAKLHLSRSPTSCLMKHRNNKIQSNRLQLIDLESLYSLSHKLIMFFPKINLPIVPLRLINSCNGLVCLGQLISCDSHYFACNIIVCNPILREYITIPKPTNVTNFHIYSCAFGFSHITNKYKVVLSSSDVDDSDNYGAEIYTLGEGSWRSIKNAPYNISNDNFYAFLDGALHWIGLVHDQYSFIRCFDFVSEQFRAVPEPSEFGQLERGSYDQMHVGVINGNLSICDFNYEVGDQVIIWVMKDYGVKESWSKDFVITHMIYDTDWDTYEPIMIKGNGKILMIFNDDSIMLYDPKSEAFEYKMKMIGASSEFHAVAYVPSLISLKDVAKGENLEVLGSN